MTTRQRQKAVKTILASLTPEDRAHKNVAVLIDVALTTSNPPFYLIQLGAAYPPGPERDYWQRMGYALMGY